MKLYPGLWLMVALFWVACKEKSNHPQVIKTLKSDLPKDFESFYERFHRDSVYQMSHIIFPLEGRPAVTDSTQVVPPDFRWQPETWLLHRPYNDGDGKFSRSFTNFHNIINEEISDASGQFTMLRRFSKMDTAWYLIYYKELGL